MSSKPKSRTLDRDRNRSLRGKGRTWFDDRAAVDHVTDRANAPKPAAARPSYRLALVRA